MNEQKTKICPHCQKEVSAKADKCPYCQSKLVVRGPHDFSKLILFASLLVIGPLVLLAILAPSSKKESTSQVTPQPQTQKSRPPTPQIEQIEYKKINLSEIANQSNLFVETNGVVIIGTPGRAATYIHLQDGQSHAILSISNTTEKDKIILSTVNNIYIGDSISVKGIAASNICDLKTRSEYKEVDSICKFLGIQNPVPVVIVAEEPKIIKKSAGTVKAIQPIPFDYSSFQEVNIDDYVKNPPAYLNKNIKATNALVSDFLAKGDRGGDTNYIMVVDARNPLSLARIMLQIDDSSNYQKAVAALNEGNIVTTYGVVKPSQSFDTSAGGSILVPVIKVLRLDGTNGIIFSSGYSN